MHHWRASGADITRRAGQIVQEGQEWSLYLFRLAPEEQWREESPINDKDRQHKTEVGERRGGKREDFDFLFKTWAKCE